MDRQRCRLSTDSNQFPWPRSRGAWFWRPRRKGTTTDAPETSKTLRASAIEGETPALGPQLSRNERVSFASLTLVGARGGMDSA
jgi:hypothetical protein